MRLRMRLLLCFVDALGAVVIVAVIVLRVLWSLCRDAGCRLRMMLR
jgi:hypothetical protein